MAGWEGPTLESQGSERTPLWESYHRGFPAWAGERSGPSTWLVSWSSCPQKRGF